VNCYFSEAAAPTSRAFRRWCRQSRTWLSSTGSPGSA